MQEERYVAPQTGKKKSSREGEEYLFQSHPSEGKEKGRQGFWRRQEIKQGPTFPKKGKGKGGTRRGKTLSLPPSKGPRQNSGKEDYPPIPPSPKPVGRKGGEDK